jgi:hypothetical protein
MSSEQRTGRNPTHWIKLLIGAGIAFGALLLWQQYERKRQQDSALGAMVSAFQKQNSLNVFRAQVPVFVRSTDPGWFGFTREQFGVVPATVEYRLDLSKVTDGDFRWDADRQVMDVVIPPVIIGEPALDARRAQLVNRGLLMSPDVALRLMQKNMAVARTKAVAEARNPQMMALARGAAREMMVRNITMPLRAAGFSEAAVSVRFADEPSSDPSYIDQSRSYNEVLEDARAKEAAGGTR